MRRCLFLVPALFAALLVGAGPTDTPTPDLTRLVQQLGDPDFQQRQRATEALRQQGTAALPALRAALDHPDPEVRRRVLELVPALETAVLLSPRRVTLKATNRTARQLLDDLAKQTGYGIDCWNDDANQVYSFDLHDVTFWEALDKVAQEAGLVLQPSYGSDRLRLMAQNAYSPHVQHNGSLPVRRRGRQPGPQHGPLRGPGNPGPARRTNSLTFTFSVSAEPRFPLLAVGEPHVEAAYDSERNSLLPSANVPGDDPLVPFGGRGRNTGRYGNRSLTQNIEVPLFRPSDKAAAIKVIRGTVPLTLLVSQKQVLLTDKPLEAKNKKIVIDRVTFVVEDVTETPTKQYQVRLSATEEGDGTLLNTLYQRIEVLDSKGNKMQNAGRGLERQWQQQYPSDHDVWHAGRRHGSGPARPDQFSELDYPGTPRRLRIPRHSLALICYSPGAKEDQASGGR